LVGDSAAQILLGFDSTLPATMDFMVAITAAVRREAPNLCLVADMPFLSYQIGIAEAVRNAGRFVTEAGAQIVKIEATRAYLHAIKAVSDSGITVMAHISIRPQSIGCGSGPGCDRQILIAPGILGLTQGQGPKFSKSSANLADATINAFNTYNKEIKAGQFPEDQHSYHMKSGELERLQELLKNKY